MSSSPIASQRSSGVEEEDDDEVMEEEEYEQEPEESESDDGSEPDRLEVVQEEDEEVEDEAENDDEAENEEEEKVEEDPLQEDSGEKINFEFSKPFKPVGPLDLKVQDPLTCDLMDSVEELKILPDSALTKLTNLWAAKNSDIRALEDKIAGRNLLDHFMTVVTIVDFRN